jgi:hypothetical protein
MGTTRLLEAMLYGVSPLDRLTWALTTVTLAAIGLLATLLPAVRATRADPLLAIRSGLTEPAHGKAEIAYSSLCRLDHRSVGSADAS